MAYAEVNPFGEGRADLRIGILTSVMASIHRKKGRPAFKASDFMPEFRRKQNVRTQSTADMYKQLDGLIRRQQVQQMMFGAPE